MTITTEALDELLSGVENVDDRRDAARVINRAMNGKILNRCVKTQLVPRLRPDDVVILPSVPYPLWRSKHSP